MTTSDRLIVNVAELLEHPGSRKRLAFEECVPGLHNDLVRIDAADELHFDLMLESMDEGILVRGPVTGRYVASCRRCLEEFAVEFRVPVAELYRRPGAGVWEEGYVVQGETIDLNPLVRDNVMLTMPMYPLCSEDCPGLCPRCGKNLKGGRCECLPQEEDDRWAALRRFMPGGEAKG